MLPEEVAGIVALVAKTIPKDTEMPRPIAHVVAPYFATIAPDELA
jgi:hypothetical protein